MKYLTILCVAMLLSGCGVPKRIRIRNFDRRMDEQIVRYQTGDVHVAEAALQSIVALHDEYKARGVQGIYVHDNYDRIKGLAEIRLALLYRELGEPQSADLFMQKGMRDYGVTNRTGEEKLLGFIDKLDRNMKVNWRGFDSQQSAAPLPPAPRTGPSEGAR